MPTSSIQETIMSDIVAQLQLIVAGATYRNTLALVSKHDMPIDQVTEFPMAFVVFNDSSVNVLNNAKTSFEEYFSVAVIGYVKSATLSNRNTNSALIDAANSLLHDLKKNMAQFVTTHLNDASKRYMIARYAPIFRIGNPLPTDDMLHAAVGLQFELKSVAQDYTFAI